MLDVATTATDEVNSLGSELGHGRLTAHLELSLLDVDDHLSSGQAALMTRITANTYTEIRFRSTLQNSTTHSSHRSQRKVQTYPSYQNDCSSDSLNAHTCDWEKGASAVIPLIINAYHISPESGNSAIPPDFMHFSNSRIPNKQTTKNNP